MRLGFKKGIKRKTITPIYPFLWLTFAVFSSNVLVKWTKTIAADAALTLMDLTLFMVKMIPLLKENLRAINPLY